MTLTTEQFDKLVATYAEQIVEGMDLKSLEQFAYDTIVANFDVVDDNTLIDEMCGFYEQEEVATLLESVGANPANYDLNVADDTLTEDQINFLRETVKKGDS